MVQIKISMKRSQFLCFICTIFFARFILAAEVVPFTAEATLFDYSKPDTLGLTFAKNCKSITVFKPTETSNKYNHGAVLFPFKGKLFIQWQSSAVDEDAPDTEVLYSRSSNIQTWTPPQTLVSKREDAVVTNGGWWSDGHTLVAYINVWPKNISPRGGYVEYITSSDGVSWSEPKRLQANNGNWVNGIIEQDLRTLPDGRILTAIHQQPGLIAKPFFTDDPMGITGWQTGEFPNLPHNPEISREIEPSWFLKKNNSIVMTFRDQAGSFRVLASVSRNNGQNWSPAVETDLYDSRAKQSAGNLPDGTAFIVNNPSGNKTRIPLVISLSQSGEHFNRAYLLRAGGDDLPVMKFDGKYKRAGFSYPKTIVWRDSLYVSYAVNKEDIALTRVPVASLLK